MRSVRDSLATLAALPEADGALDTYGDGALMQQLEADVAPRPIAGAAGGARQGSCRLSHAALS
jgi:glycerate kinase